LQPSLSLIFPVHNAETTLCASVHRLLEVLPEVAARFELLIIDDGSTDQTSELAHELAREYPQVRIARHERRRGVEAALSTGSAKAQGELLLVQTQEQLLPASSWKQNLQQRTRQPSGTSSQPCDVSMPKRLPEPLTTSLLERLSRWGEAQPADDRIAAPIGQLSSPHFTPARAPAGGSRAGEGSAALGTTRERELATRPVYFLAHLRDLSRRS
jgi:hypothetical protein